MGSTGEVITYRQLDEAAIRLSNVLRDAGLNPGDHVALCLENHARYLEILWAVITRDLSTPRAQADSRVPNSRTS